jgi:hypothetical protein
MGLSRLCSDIAVFQSACYPSNLTCVSERTTPVRNSLERKLPASSFDVLPPYYYGKASSVEKRHRHRLPLFLFLGED